LQTQRDKTANGAPLKRSKAFAGKALVGGGFIHRVATIVSVLWRLGLVGVQSAN